jgi:large subunit ribosomal protein L7Ae
MMAENSDSKALEAIELAKKTGKIKKGINEVTKAVERGKAKLVVIAKDVNPPEITMHLPALCEEKGAILVEVAKREDLGAAAGLGVPTTAIAIVEEGEAKDIIKQLAK